jgi:hypothetical protein
MIELQHILSKKVSYVDKANSKYITRNVSIKDVLAATKNGQLEFQINKLRQFISNGQFDLYDTNKKFLPAVTFCGVFNERRKKDSLAEYNSLIVLDIDKLSPDELIKVHEQLSNDSYVFALWYSPSGNGIKGLVSLNYAVDISDDIDKYHKIAFQQLESYLFEKYEIKLDASGKDTTRLCFYSSDKNLILKDNSLGFNVDATDDEQVIREKKSREPKEKIFLTNKTVRNISQKDILFNSKDKNNQHNRYLMHDLIKYLEKRKLSITNSYEDWFRVATAIANTFTYDIGIKYFQRLSKIDTLKYNEVACTNMLISIYENKLPEKINFETIIYLAQKQGYEINNKGRSRSGR